MAEDNKPELPTFDAGELLAIEQASARISRYMRSFENPANSGERNTNYLIDLRDLKQMAALQDLFFEHDFRSHRRIIGPLIILIKKLAISLCNKVLKISLVRQIEINQRNWQLAFAVYHLERRLNLLEAALKQKDNDT